MYFTPSLTLPDVELSAYSAMRMRYRAELPPGVDQLLIMLAEEGGGQYVVQPDTGSTDDWKSVTFPLSEVRLGSWSNDANGQFDPGRVERVIVGAHGSPTGDGGRGRIWIESLEFVPPKENGHADSPTKKEP